MRYLVAVSGGIDSVVLLDMLVREGEHELVVAHFDHGIRDDSAADARFVKALAEEKYHLPFVSKREELGANSSEELARNRRYDFLRSEAEKLDAIIVTAHHSGDIIETIANNIIRGTGWRGVAVLDSPDIVRPMLLSMTKDKIRTYAKTKRLEWVEDSTNAEVKYLRNRTRRNIALHLSRRTRRRVLDLWQRQVILRASIDNELQAHLQDDGKYSRHFLTNIDAEVACELIRAIVLARGKNSPTRPQMTRALLAIKTAKPNTKADIGGGVILRFTARTFIVETP
jgi:tRNA(Ile)-lysidine synthase